MLTNRRDSCLFTLFCCAVTSRHTKKKWENILLLLLFLIAGRAGLDRQCEKRETEKEIVIKIIISIKLFAVSYKNRKRIAKITKHIWNSLSLFFFCSPFFAIYFYCCCCSSEARADCVAIVGAEVVKQQ